MEVFKSIRLVHKNLCFTSLDYSCSWYPVWEMKVYWVLIWTKIPQLVFIFSLEMSINLNCQSQNSTNPLSYWVSRTTVNTNVKTYFMAYYIETLLIRLDSGAASSTKIWFRQRGVSRSWWLCYSDFKTTHFGGQKYKKVGIALLSCPS